MSKVEEKLKELGYTLTAAPSPVGSYIPARQSGNLVFLSGAIPRRQDGSLITGKLGRELTQEEGSEAARLCGVNLLANLKAAIGDLDKVVYVVKVVGMVNSDPEFGDHPAVINGCSDLFAEVFGERGRHARSALGVAALPFGIAVEVEAIVEVEE